jgi:hypothetical protein
MLVLVPYFAGTCQKEAFSSACAKKAFFPLQEGRNYLLSEATQPQILD